MQRPGEQQLGITNNLPNGRKDDASVCWYEVDSTGPHLVWEVLDTENAFKKWLRKEIGLVSDKIENWYTSKMEFHSLAELNERSDIEIETSTF